MLKCEKDSRHPTRAASAKAAGVAGRISRRCFWGMTWRYGDADGGAVQDDVVGSNTGNDGAEEGRIQRVRFAEGFPVVVPSVDLMAMTSATAKGRSRSTLPASHGLDR